MSNLDAAFGFMPLMPILHTQEYRVNAANTYGIFVQDLVVKEAAGTIIQHVIGTTNVTCGTVMSIKDGTGMPVGFAPATCGAGYTVVVADDPNQYFVAQDDGESQQIALADCGASFETIGEQGGNEVTGISIMEIDASSTGATAADNLNLIALYPAINNAVGANARWVVKIQNHQNGIAIVGVNV